MTRRRFYAPPAAFSADHQSVALGTDEAQHMRNVLRLKAGDEVYVFDGVGKEFKCSIEESGRDTARLRLISEVAPYRPESSLRLSLAVALLKGEKFDLVVQKATELGVFRILPTITKLADIRLRDEDDATKRATRWRRIALEAAKQSGRALIPEVTMPRPVVDLFGSESVLQETKVMFSERSGESFPEFKARISQRPQSIIALVGSEGGWTDEEIKLAREHQWSVVTLGGRTLRAETAAITVAVLLQHTFGDLV